MWHYIWMDTTKLVPGEETVKKNSFLLGNKKVEIFHVEMFPAKLRISTKLDKLRSERIVDWLLFIDAEQTVAVTWQPLLDSANTGVDPGMTSADVMLSAATQYLALFIDLQWQIVDWETWLCMSTAFTA